MFWTKNIGPMLKHLPELKERGYPFVIQHTMNGYPRELEKRVIDAEQVIESCRTLVDTYGPDVLIWRYDPIVFSSLTPDEWHIENFARIAEGLAGYTNEVVISFEQTYAKTRTNTDLAAQQHGFTWTPAENVELARKKQLAYQLAEVASCLQMQTNVCTQPDYLVTGLIKEAKCVDADRLERVAGYNFPRAQKEIRGMGKDCRCFQNVDIGEYDTCPHGCVYCYATKTREIALAHNKAHDPRGEFLFPPQGI